jgi:hypothetical protein
MIFDIWGTERRRSLTAGEKNHLIRLARGKCEYCGGEIIGKGIVPEIHHIVPFASRGSDSAHNLIVLCPNCHSKVDQISREELRAKIAYRLPKKGAVIAKETATKKTPAKKTANRKTTPKKTIAKEATARKSTPKKTTAKKATARKNTPKKTTAKKATARKSTSKRTTAKKSTTRKTTPKKTTSQKRR